MKVTQLIIIVFLECTQLYCVESLIEISRNRAYSFKLRYSALVELKTNRQLSQDSLISALEMLKESERKKIERLKLSKFLLLHVKTDSNHQKEVEKVFDEGVNFETEVMLSLLKSLEDYPEKSLILHLAQKSLKDSRAIIVFHAWVTILKHQHPLSEGLKAQLLAHFPTLSRLQKDDHRYHISISDQRFTDLFLSLGEEFFGQKSIIDQLTRALDHFESMSARYSSLGRRSYRLMNGQTITLTTTKIDPIIVESHGLKTSFIFQKHPTPQLYLTVLENSQTKSKNRMRLFLAFIDGSCFKPLCHNRDFEHKARQLLGSTDVELSTMAHHILEFNSSDYREKMAEEDRAIALDIEEISSVSRMTNCSEEISDFSKTEEK